MMEEININDPVIDPAIGTTKQGVCFHCTAEKRQYKEIDHIDDAKLELKPYMVNFVVEKVKPARNNSTKAYRGRCPECAAQGHYPFKRKVAKPEIAAWERAVLKAALEGANPPPAPPRSSRPGARVCSIRTKEYSEEELKQRNELKEKQEEEKKHKREAKEAKRDAVKKAKLEKKAKREAKAALVDVKQD